MSGDGMQRATLMLGLAGGVVGMVLSAVVIVSGAVDSDPHEDGMVFGVTALVGAAAGATGAVFFARGVKPLAMALSMMLAAAVHVVSSPLLGTPGGLLLLLAGLCGLFAFEEVAARGRETGGAAEWMRGAGG